MGKPFCNFEYGEDICSSVWVAVAMADVVTVKDTRNASWYPFLSKHTWPWFFGDNVSENKRFVFDINCELKSASFRPINEQWSEISPQCKN